MAFDFAALKKKKITDTVLKCIILGCSASGKSFAIGTLKLPTLFLHLSGESHGPISASASNENILPVCFDKDENGEMLSADAALAKLYDILKADLVKEGFKAIALDSITDLELLIVRTTRFITGCTTDKGKIDAFRKPEMMMLMLSEIFDLIDKHQQKGVHFIATVAAHVTAVDSEGGAETIAPVLSSYGVVEKVIRVFNDVLLVTTTEIDGERKRCFSFTASVNKVSKDITGKVKKTLNFSPRITGLKDEDIPSVMPVDLEKVLTLKRG